MEKYRAIIDDAFEAPYRFASFWLRGEPWQDSIVCIE